MLSFASAPAMCTCQNAHNYIMIETSIIQPRCLGCLFACDFFFLSFIAFVHSSRHFWVLFMSACVCVCICVYVYVYICCLITHFNVCTSERANMLTVCFPTTFLSFFLLSICAFEWMKKRISFVDFHFRFHHSIFHHWCLSKWMQNDDNK